MNIPKYSIVDTAGQWTPIIEGVYSDSDKSLIGRVLLQTYPLAGQVAFIAAKKKLPCAVMMGNELSINGTIAVATYASSNKLYASGVKEVLKAVFSNQQTTVTFPLSLVKSISGTVVQLTGIKYKLMKSAEKMDKDQLRRFCGSYPAAGVIYEKGPGVIIPIVYVKATNTLLEETACGSASIAYSILSGKEMVIQPSRQAIRIVRNSATLSVSTPVKRIAI
jgi:histidine racemase